VNFNFLTKVTVIILFVSPCFFSSIAEPIIITSIDSKKIEPLSLFELKNLYTGKIRKIKIVVLSSGDTHNDFIKNYIKKTTTQFKQHWKKLLFTGKASLPHECSTQKEMIEYISKNPGTIGYIDSELFNKDLLVKVAIK